MKCASACSLLPSGSVIRMKATKLSPTANLLRNSRLFSLPPPLPRPSHDVSINMKNTSDSATLPYPTHAAIETPQSSLSRGDWGLKRPLPLRATTGTSTPTVRVDAIDTWEHITNFESAADHVLTLRKWQELNVPMSVPTGARRRTQLPDASNGLFYDLHQSVFERRTDNTVSDEQTQLQGTQRWKFKGPWLAGKSEGEFSEYLEKEIRRRKPEFQRYLRKRCSAEKLQHLKQAATDKGEDLDEIEESPEVTEEEYLSYVKHLRRNHATLSTIIHQFLDLPVPPAPASATRGTSGWATTEDKARASITALYSETGPPQTHPSAGLSYLRTSSYLTNHPKLGPQLKKPPVRGRVLRTMRDASNRRAQPLVGIAGVVAEDMEHRNFGNDQSGIMRYDGTIVGGAKTWYHPTKASIDAQGRIKLSIDPADEDTIAIYGVEAKSEAVDSAITNPSDRSWEGPALSNGAATRTSYSRVEPLKVSAGQSSMRDSHFKIIERRAPTAGL